MAFDFLKKLCISERERELKKLIDEIPDQDTKDQFFYDYISGQWKILNEMKAKLETAQLQAKYYIYDDKLDELDKTTWKPLKIDQQQRLMVNESNGITRSHTLAIYTDVAGRSKTYEFKFSERMFNAMDIYVQSVSGYFDFGIQVQGAMFDYEVANGGRWSSLYSERHVDSLNQEQYKIRFPVNNNIKVILINYNADQEVMFKFVLFYSSDNKILDDILTKNTEIDTAIDTIDGVLDNILTKNTEIDTILDTIDGVLDTIDGVLDNILTKNTQIDNVLDNILTKNTQIDNVLDAIDTVLDKIETNFKGKILTDSQNASTTKNMDFESDNDYIFHTLGINIYSSSSLGNWLLTFYTYINGDYRQIYYKNIVGNDYVQLYIPILSKKCRIAIQTLSGVSAWYECIASYKPLVSAIYDNSHDY